MMRSGATSMSSDEKIAAACRDAAEQAVARAEQTQTQVIVWKDGKIVRMTAAEARAELDAKLKQVDDNG